MAGPTSVLDAEYGPPKAVERLPGHRGKKSFVEQAFRDGAVPVTGKAITTILPPASRFSPDGGHGERQQRVLARLGAFFERFFGLSAGSNEE